MSVEFVLVVRQLFIPDVEFRWCVELLYFFFFQAEDGIRDLTVTGVQTCALPISARPGSPLGFFSPAEPDAVALRADLDGAELLNALAHELLHAEARGKGFRRSQDRKSVV